MIIFLLVIYLQKCDGKRSWNLEISGEKNMRLEEYFEIVLLVHKTFAYKKNTQNTMQY